LDLQSIRRASPSTTLSARPTHVRPTRWRCGWCSRDRDGRPRAPAPLETTGMCEPCLSARRAVGFTQSGPCFMVWDEDAREAAAWARELRAARPTPRREPAPAGAGQ
jgi:hypothetical protein